MGKEGGEKVETDSAILIDMTLSVSPVNLRGIEEHLEGLQVLHELLEQLLRVPVCLHLEGHRLEQGQHLRHNDCFAWILLLLLSSQYNSRN